MKKAIRDISVLLGLLMFASTVLSQSGYRRLRGFEEVNSPIYDELGLCFFPGGGIIFSTNRRSELLSAHRPSSDQYFYNIYTTKIDESGKKWEKPKLFSKSLLIKDNVTWPSITEDGETLFFVSTNRNNDTISSIYISYSKGKNGWTAPEPFIYTNSGYNMICPSVTPDGNRLYFSSENPEGYGGYDIYFCRRTGNTWTKPVNMGPVINTSTDEITPFYHPDGRLYFASKGHNGEGGLDIFYTEKVDNEWIRPIPDIVNNRRGDQFGFIASQSLDTVFLFSNRRGTDDIIARIKTFSNFPDCPMQIEETFCFKFEEAGTMSLDTTSLSYEWDFGDGHKKRSVKAKHCFEKPGFYLVQLNVIDTLTNEVYFSQATYELPVEEVEQPYITAPDTAYVGQRIDFNSDKSSIRSFETDEFYWDFRDGGEELGKKVRYTYETPGVYLVKLGILGNDQDGNQQKKCSQKEITILERD